MDPLTRNGGFIGVTLDFGSEEQYIVAGSVANVTHVGATTLSGSGSLTLPSGLQQDDIVMVFMADDNNNGGSAPSGWTTLVAENFTNSVWNSVWYKIMGATPDTSVTVPAVSAWVASAYRGVDTTTPFDVSYTGPSTGENASPDSPSITTSADGCMIVSFAGLDDDNSAASTTAPSGYTMSGVEDNDGTCMVAYKKQTTAGAEDPGSFSSTPDAWVGYTFALKPGVEYGNYKNSGIWDLQAVYDSLFTPALEGVSLIDSSQHRGTLLVPRPTNYAAGDMLFIFAGSSSGNNIDPLLPPSGQGFVEVEYFTGNVGGCWMKTMSASEPTSYLFTDAQSGDRVNFASVVVRGGSNYVSAFTDTGTAPALTFPSEGLFFAFHFVEGTGTYSPPTGFTEIIYNSWTEATIGLAYTEVFAGSNGPYTAGGSLTNHSISVGIY